MLAEQLLEMLLKQLILLSSATIKNSKSTKLQKHLKRKNKKKDFRRMF